MSASIFNGSAIKILKNILRFKDGTEISSTDAAKLVTTDGTQTLTNKSIDADQNTITNIEDADIKAAAAIDATKLADGSVSNTELQHINTVTSNVQDQLDSKLNLSGGTLTGTLILSGDGSNSLDAVTKQQLDAALEGVQRKKSVKAATTANITPSGTQTIDGIALTAGDRVLVKNQTVANENGIYEVAAGSWTRTLDANTSAEITHAIVSVEEGSVNLNKAFEQMEDNPSLGVDDVVWFQAYGSGTYVADESTLTLSGSTFSVATGGVTDNEVASGIDAAKLADGSVSNTELQYINSVTSNVQDQINSLSSVAQVKCDLHDASLTTLPTGTTVDIDGETLVNGDRVLFTALTVGANQVYEVSGVGSALSFSALPIFAGSTTPTDGQLITIATGDAFKDQTATFNGTDFKFNEYIRLFDGANYQEISSIKRSTAADNAITDIIDVALVGSENMHIVYSIARGVAKEAGTIMLSGTGSTATINRNATAVSGDVGVEFSASIAASNIKLTAATTSTGSDATITYYLTRWSDSAGGPASIPSYASLAPGVPADGSQGEIQFKGASGDLEASSELTYDTTANELSLGGLKRSILSSPITINDNQISALTAFSFDSGQFNFAMVDYSLVRGTEYRVGQFLIWTDGTTTSLVSSHNESGDPGVLFASSMSGATCNIQYTSTSTGNSGVFKYSIKKWS